MWLFLVGTAVFAALLYKYFNADSNKDFWKNHGVPEIDTSPAMSTLDLLLNRKPMTVKDTYAYCQMDSDDKFCGVWDMGKPLLLVKDTELIKRVLIKHFDHFVDRRQFFGDGDFILRKILTTLEGEEWKGVRTSVSPTFTTGKIRRMMSCFNEVGAAWVHEFTKNCQNGGGSTNIRVVKAVNRYAMDVIASTAFGFNANTIANPDNQFASMGLRVTELSFWVKLKFIILVNFPLLRKLTGLDLFDMEAIMWFDNVLKQGLHSRLEGQIKRNDFVQLLVEAQKGELKLEEEKELDTFEKDAQLTGSFPKKNWLTDEVMRAQCIQFFLAGLGTVSGVLSFALYALALNPKVQTKLREEVRKIVKEDGSVDYDDVNKHVYLDMVICEILRKFPPLQRLERVCNVEYQDSETGLVVPKGTIVGIPLHAIHNNKEYYEYPEKFYPEHFAPDVKAARNPYAYMPFGVGPRNCIGMRFALTEVKTALAQIVHNFQVDPSPNTPVPLKTVSMGFAEVPPNNLELKLTLTHK